MAVIEKLNMDDSETKSLMHDHVESFCRISEQYYLNEENHNSLLERCESVSGYKPNISIDFMKQNKITYMKSPTALHFMGTEKYMVEALKYSVCTNNLEEMLKEFSYLFSFTSDYVRGVKKETIRNLI